MAYRRQSAKGGHGVTWRRPARLMFHSRYCDNFYLLPNCIFVFGRVFLINTVIKTATRWQVLMFVEVSNPFVNNVNNINMLWHSLTPREIEVEFYFTSEFNTANMIPEFRKNTMIQPNFKIQLNSCNTQTLIPISRLINSQVNYIARSHMLGY